MAFLLQIRDIGQIIRLILVLIAATVHVVVDQEIIGRHLLLGQQPRQAIVNFVLSPIQEYKDAPTLD